jgi:CubicO group peptidase (beta-lactamase class C family)
MLVARLRRLLGLVSPAAFVVASLAGCSNGDGGATSGPKRVTTGVTVSSSDAASSSVSSSGSSTSTGAGGSGGAGGGAPAVSYPVPDWSTGNPVDYGFDPTLLDAAVSVAESKNSTCFLVIRHGTIISEHYWQGHDATSVDASWSIAKSYTSALVGIAVARGDIGSLDDSASKYLPEWKGTDKEAITIRNLLDMTSGLQWSAFQDYVSMATFSEDNTEFAVDLPLDETPGTNWTYHNGGVQIFEPIFRNATGMAMDAYAQAYLWSKIGSHATWKHDGAGHPTAYANVLAPCRDHARLGYLYLHGGNWNGEQVVPSAYVTETLQPSQNLNRAYGFLWWLNGQTPAIDAMGQAWSGQMVSFAPPDLFAARGFGNQFIDVIPSLDLMVVRFAPDPATGQFDLQKLILDQHFGEHDAILQPVLAALVHP